MARIVYEDIRTRTRIRAICGNCNSLVYLSPSEISLRKLFGIPVNSFTCPGCNRTVYAYTYEFTENLISELKRYKELYTELNTK